MISEIDLFGSHQKTKRCAKLLLSILLSILFSGNSFAVDIVHDPIHTAVNLENWITTEIKQGLQYEKQLDQWIQEHTTALKETEAVENQILQMSRMGNMTSLMHLPGVSNLVTAQAIYGQWQQNIGTIEGLTNPQGYNNTVTQILNQYKQPLTGFGNGQYGSSVQGLFQFAAADYNTLSDAQQQIQALMDKKASLKADLDTATAAMESSTDNTTQMKYHAQIAALSAGIAQIDAQIANVKAATEMQMNKTRAAQQVYQAQVQQQSANGYNNELLHAVADGKSVAPLDLTLPHWPEGQ